MSHKWECGDPFPNGCKPLWNVPGHPETGWTPPKGLERTIDITNGVPVEPIKQIPLYNFTNVLGWFKYSNHIATTFSPTSWWDKLLDSFRKPSSK